jgi:hypothetical protein
MSLAGVRRARSGPTSFSEVIDSALDLVVGLELIVRTYSIVVVVNDFGVVISFVVFRPW